MSMVFLKDLAEFLSRNHSCLSKLKSVGHFFTGG